MFKDLEVGNCIERTGGSRSYAAELQVYETNRRQRITLAVGWPGGTFEKITRSSVAPRSAPSAVAMAVPI